MLKNWKVQEIGGAVALLICGLVLLLMPELTLVTIANVIGILVIIIGAFFLIGYFLRKELAAGNNDLIKGLVIVCIGIFICVKSELVVSVASGFEKSLSELSFFPQEMHNETVIKSIAILFIII